MGNGSIDDGDDLLIAVVAHANAGVPPRRDRATVSVVDDQRDHLREGPLDGVVLHRSSAPLGPSVLNGLKCSGGD